MSARVHEEAFVRSFVDRRRRQRFFDLLRNEKRRGEALKLLAHSDLFIDRFCQEIPPSEQEPNRIHSILQSLGAPSRCYVISEDKSLDRQELELTDALTRVIGKGAGTAISCLPGILAYFEGEDAGVRFLLEKR